MKKINIRYNDKRDRWDCDVYFQGQRKHFTSSQQSKRKAEIEIQNKYQEWADLVSGNIVKKRLKDVWEAYFADYKSKNKITIRR